MGVLNQINSVSVPPAGFGDITVSQHTVEQVEEFFFLQIATQWRYWV